MEKIALLPGGFKPPHAGHYNMAKWLASNTDANTVVIKIGAKDRDNISRDMALSLFNLYRTTDKDPISQKITILPSTENSPVRDVYDFIENEAPEGSTIYLGMGEKDINDQRFANINKFAKPKGIKFETVLVPPQAGGISGTEMRNFIKDGDKKSFNAYIPHHLNNQEKEKAWNIVSSLNEQSGTMTNQEKAKHAKNLKRLNKDLKKINKGNQYVEVPKYLKGTLTRKLYEAISPEELDSIEAYADELFKIYDIDVEFTKHFISRINDARNKKEISKEELLDLFKKAYEKHGEDISQQNPGFEAVLNDISKELNLPFVLQYDSNNDELDLIAKTIMRKKNFQTSNPKLALESKTFSTKWWKNHLREIFNNDQIIINNMLISVEVMNTPEEQARGMMGRDSLEGGMLFPYNGVEERSMWMKDCLIPLDIVFITQGEITNISEECPPCLEGECPHYKALADNVLELPGGYCKQKGINIGDRIEFSQEEPYGDKTSYRDYWKSSDPGPKPSVQPNYKYKRGGMYTGGGMGFGGMYESRGGESELHIYDFDDTIAQIETDIQVTLPNGETRIISSPVFPEESEKLEKEFGKDIKYDFSGFNKQIDSAILNGKVYNDLINSLSNPNVKTTILTARTVGHPVTQYLKSLGLPVTPYVEALGIRKQGNRVTGQDKADWIEKHLKKSTKKVYFIDDAPENRKAVYALRDKYSNIEFNIETPPKIDSKEKINEMKLFSKDWWLNILTEGGAAGHMAHPFDLPNVISGKDLKNIFEKSSNSLNTTPGSVKIDGVNSSIRLVSLDGVKQFVMDRGSKKELDLKGITKDDLLNRFGKGHGMVKVGGEVLDLFNEALPQIQSDLESLGLWEDPNILFNMEYVSGKTNVQEYSSNFIAIHGLNKIESKEVQGKRGMLTKRVSSEINYSKETLQSLLDKLKPIAKKRGYEIYGSVPTEMNKKPNFNNALSQQYTVEFTNEQKTQTLDKWLDEVNAIPKDEFIFINTDNTPKKVGAVSKQVYQVILNGENVDDLFDNEEDKKKAIDGFVTYLATEKLGDEVLKVLDSPMGSVENHEGVVIRDEEVSSIPFKITGKFILGGLSTTFRK